MSWPAQSLESPHALASHARDNGASDVHINALTEGYRIRVRIANQLHEVSRLDAEQGRVLIQKIKSTCAMNIAETRSPQDGRFSIERNITMDIRVATHPCIHGENLVMRLLHHPDNLDLDHLGFGRHTQERMRRALSNDQGMILVAGPTGSGKTTTLHALLRLLDHEAGNVMTLEDPVEIRWSQAVQTDLSLLPKMDFQSGLRSILRQDPDVILVGEIRDAETAQLAFQATLTGHRVFASIHAHDSAGVLSRLLDLGIAHAKSIPLLNTVICQRLVSCGHATVKPIAEVWNTGLLTKQGHRHYPMDTHCASWFANDVFWSLEQSLEELGL